MNIMLVSVTERTREIGVRMAVGARRREIRNQFLTEATLFCLFGGVIGLVSGVVVTWAVAKLAGQAIFLGTDAMLFAIIFAASIGVFFGYYPARKAARLQPVEALRSEQLRGRRVDVSSDLLGFDEAQLMVSEKIRATL